MISFITLRYFFFFFFAFIMSAAFRHALMPIFRCFRHDDACHYATDAAMMPLSFSLFAAAAAAFAFS